MADTSDRDDLVLLANNRGSRTTALVPELKILLTA